MPIGSEPVSIREATRPSDDLPLGLLAVLSPIVRPWLQERLATATAFLSLVAVMSMRVMKGGKWPST